MIPASPEPIADVHMPPHMVSAILSSSHDFAAAVDADGVVVSWNGRCPCGRHSCSLYDLGLADGETLPPILAGDVMAGASLSGRHRVVVDLPVHGAPAPTEATMTRLSSDPSLFLLALRDVTDAAEQAVRASLVASEMGHRLANAYAIAMAILSSSAREDDPVAAALRRLDALSRIQALTRGSPSTSLASVAALVAEGVQAEGVTADGPRFEADLTVAQAQALLVVAGELCTNSLKHGALRHGGNVRIVWRATDGGVAMDWIEDSPVVPLRGSREGASGFRIMSSMMRAARGRLVDEWPPEGLKVTAELPAAAGEVSRVG